MDFIVNSSTGVTLIGGGETGAADLALAMRFAPLLVAADGGALTARATGLDPVAVIGDLDSLDAEAQAMFRPGQLHRIAEQETTDFDKALRSIRAPLILGVGFSGGRLDHELAALNSLMSHPDQRCILLRQSDLVFLAPPRLDLDLSPGSRLSLLPLAPVLARSEGLTWPLEGPEFRPGGRLGASNEVSGAVRLWFDRPAMLVNLPRDSLPALLPGLAAAPAWGEAPPSGWTAGGQG